MRFGEILYFPHNSGAHFQQTDIVSVCQTANFMQGYIHNLVKHQLKFVIICKSALASVRKWSEISGENMRFDEILFFA